MGESVSQPHKVARLQLIIPYVARGSKLTPDRSQLGRSWGPTVGRMGLLATQGISSTDLRRDHLVLVVALGREEVAPFVEARLARHVLQALFRSSFSA